MENGMVSKTVVVVLVLSLAFSVCTPAAQAQKTTLMQKIFCIKYYIMDPSGRETLCLVNKFNDTVEYAWGSDGWRKAPRHLQHCYENQPFIRANARGRKRR